MKRTKAAGFLLALLMTAGQVTAALASEPELALPAGVPARAVSRETAQIQAEAGDAAASQTAIQISAPSAVLMEASTGQIIYEKGADDKRNPASVTKVMTLILIFDALAEGKIQLSDEVVTSAHAKSMGGSQDFFGGRGDADGGNTD